jgi:hypothetical protein
LEIDRTEEPDPDRRPDGSEQPWTGPLLAGRTGLRGGPGQ